MNREKAASESEEIAKLLFGVIVGCALGFVFGWAWRQRPDAIADVSILAALTAVGTVGATFAAFLVPELQRSSAAKAKRQDDIERSRLLARNFQGTLARFSKDLDAFSVLVAPPWNDRMAEFLWCRPLSNSQLLTIYIESAISILDDVKVVDFPGQPTSVNRRLKAKNRLKTLEKSVEELIQKLDAGVYV